MKEQELITAVEQIAALKPMEIFLAQREPMATLMALKTVTAEAHRLAARVRKLEQILAEREVA